MQASLQLIQRIVQRLHLPGDLIDLAAFALCLCSLIGIFRYLATELRQEMAELRHERNVLEENYARVWRQFKGLEAYEAGGKHYLLTKRGWKIRLAGIAEDRNANAWETPVPADSAKPVQTPLQNTTDAKQEERL